MISKNATVDGNLVFNGVICRMRNFDSILQNDTMTVTSITTGTVITYFTRIIRNCCANMWALISVFPYHHPLIQLRK